MCNIRWAFFKMTIFSFIPLIYMLQSHNELCCEIHLRDCRLNNSPRIVVGAFSGSLGDSLPKGAKFCWNDKKQMRWDEMRWKKLSFCTNLRATDRFICPNRSGVCTCTSSNFLCFVQNSPVKHGLYIRNLCEPKWFRPRKHLHKKIASCSSFVLSFQ